VLFSYLLAHDAQEEVLPSGSDHGAPAVAEPTWARHLGLTLSPAYCFRVAVIPAIVCVLLAMSIPGAKNVLFAPFMYKNDHFTKTGSGQT
jgi:hypothetical protein